MTYELTGWLGLLLIHGSRVPQLILMLASKQARGLSLSSNVAVFLGLASYLVYSIAVHDRVFIASNVIGMAGQGWVCWLNWKWRERSVTWSKVEAVHDGYHTHNEATREKCLTDPCTDGG